MVVGADIDAVDQGSLLAGRLLVLLLGRGGHEGGCIVSEDTSQDHDHGDGEQDPVAGGRAVSIVDFSRGGMMGALQELGIPMDRLDG